jgi:hypothetical protein
MSEILTVIFSYKFHDISNKIEIKIDLPVDAAKISEHLRGNIEYHDGTQLDPNLHHSTSTSINVLRAHR